MTAAEKERVLVVAFRLKKEKIPITQMPPIIEQETGFYVSRNALGEWLNGNISTRERYKDTGSSFAGRKRIQ